LLDELKERAADLENRVLCSDGTCIGTVENGKCRVCGKPYHVDNTNASTQTGLGQNPASQSPPLRRQNRKIMLILAAVIAVGVAYIVAHTAWVQKKTVRIGAISGENTLDYRILNEDIYDGPIKTQIRLEVLAPGNITENGLRRLLNDLYLKNQQRRGFKYHDQPTHIAIYVYSSKERAESGWGQWIGMFLKLGENANPEIKINQQQLSQLGKKPEVKLGLSEEKRKQIWRDIILAERRGEVEAEKRYPLIPLKVGQLIVLTDNLSIIRNYKSISDALNQKDLQPGTKIKILRIKEDVWTWCLISVVGKNTSGWTTSANLAKQIGDPNSMIQKFAEKEGKLMDKYVNQVAKKYRITNEDIGKIKVEGIQKEWPIPKRND
jgi:hypothetical protein